MNTASPAIQQHTSDVLLLPTSTGTLCIPIDAIIRIEASSNYSKVFCKSRSFPIVVAKLLKWFEERLPEESFTRIHRTHLVNKTYVVATRNNNSVLLESGIQISISRRKRKKCLAVIKKKDRITNHLF